MTNLLNIFHARTSLSLFPSGFPRIITKVFSDFLCLRDILISFSGWRTPRAEKIVHCTPCTCSFQIAASHWSIKRPVHQTMRKAAII